MDAKMFIQTQIAAAWRTSDDVTSNLTDDLLNWTPPGAANTISATLGHILGGEDRFIQTLIMGKPRIFDAENWGERIGIGVLPRPGIGWDEYKGQKLSLDAFKAYQEAVRASTNTYLETLSPEELDRKVDFGGRPMSVAEVLAHLVIHITEHSGEIAALKGIQGTKGLSM